LESEGAEAISFRAIARSLAVSHAAPAHHFADRTALLSELAAQGYERLGDAIEQALTESNPEKRLVTVGEAYVRFALANPEIYKMMFASRLLSGECADNLLIASQRAYMLLLEAAHGQPFRGDPASYRVDTPELAAWSMVHGLVMLWLDGQLGPIRTEEEFLGLVDRILSAHFG
jgi:AcrR family transcriptional regulator